MYDSFFSRLLEMKGERSASSDSPLFRLSPKDNRHGHAHTHTNKWEERGLIEFLSRYGRLQEVGK